MPGTPHLQIQKSHKSKYYMYGQELESVDSAKYLGVNIGAVLSWNSHISKITSTANRTLDFFLTLRNVKTKNKEIKTLAYHSSL